MTKKSKFNIFIFVILSILGICVYLKIPCIFKSIFHIPCPGCGLTRSFKAIVHLSFINSFKYNILGIPLFIFFLYFVFLELKDLVKKENKTFDTIKVLFEKYYIIVLGLIFLSEFINIIKEI